MPTPPKGTPEYDAYIQKLSNSHKGQVPSNKGKRRPPETIEEKKDRFLAKVEKQPDGCWHWIAGIFKQTGYGQFMWESGRARTAHRSAYELFIGPIPDGLLVCHKCDIKKCVNPAHLFLGTSSDNINDCVKKGRHQTPFRNQRGEAVNTAKLTEAQVREIKRLSAEGKSRRYIADTCGATISQVKLIRMGKTWKHIA